MQITQNSTGLPAQAFPSTDKKGKEYCTVILKGTYDIQRNGSLQIAEKQAEFVYSDVYYKEPDTSSIKYESDFAPYKPKADIIVNAYAVAEESSQVEELDVTLDIDGQSKTIHVIGNRFWCKNANRNNISETVVFNYMPLIYENAFGGSDHTHKDNKFHGTELRNPVGKGFLLNADSDVVDNKELPNLERPDNKIQNWDDKPEPIGFGALGRAWHPRAKYAGTYDNKWLDEIYPFLPDNFDEHYFQSAPPDQQREFFTGDEKIGMYNMTTNGFISVTIPANSFTGLFNFQNNMEQSKLNLDTVLIIPHKAKTVLTWRSRIPIGRKLSNLKEIRIS